MTTPAATLDELLEQAAAGQGVALNTDFEQAFWGVPAFGGRLFDEDGRVVLEYLGKKLIGIDGLSAHDCRHYWATDAARNGTDPV